MNRASGQQRTPQRCTNKPVPAQQDAERPPETTGNARKKRSKVLVMMKSLVRTIWPIQRPPSIRRVKHMRSVGIKGFLELGIDPSRM